MSEARRRTILYVGGLLLAGALLAIGFGITVPPDPEVRLNGATLLAGMGQFDEALAICDQVLDEHPENADARVFRATFLAMAKRYDEALEAYEDALRYADDETARNLRQDRASILLELGRLDEFERERAVIAKEGGYRVHVLDGLVAAKKKDWAASIAAYRKAARESDGDLAVKNLLWNALMDDGDRALAQRDFERARRAYADAMEVHEQPTQAHLKAAEVCLAMSRPVEALALLRKAGPRMPGVGPLVFRGATGLLELGQVDPAIEALEGAFEVDPKGTRVLLQSEPAWSKYLQDSRVKELVEWSKNPRED